MHSWTPRFVGWRSWTPLFIIIMFFALLLCILFLNFLSTSNSRVVENLPPRVQSFVGRRTDIDKLLEHLEFSANASRIIQITGSPGFGKSTLAIHIGHIVIIEGVEVKYVDVDEVTGQHELENRLMLENSQPIYQWSRSLDRPTLIIFDNCDKHFESRGNKYLSKTIAELLKYSDYYYLKILTTSRRHVSYTEKYHFHVIEELSSSQSCDLLQHMTDSLNSTVCPVIANLTGNAPLALKVVASVLNMPDSPKAEQIILQLEEDLITTLSPDNLEPSQDRLNVSINLSYQYLDNTLKRIGRLLSHFPGSFDQFVSAEIVSNYGRTTHNTLHQLCERSLLNKNIKTQRYVFHKLISEFFRDMSTPGEAKEFNTYFLDYYSKRIKREKKSFIEIVPKFDDDEQNFKHFFDQLSVNITGNLDGIKRLRKITDIVSNFGITALSIPKTQIGPHNEEANNFMGYSQSKLNSAELIHYVTRSHLSNLKKTNKVLIDMYGLDWFATTYSKLVINVLGIEHSLTNDTTTLIKSMNEYEWLFEYHGEVISKQIYITFFSRLAKYYEVLPDYGMATRYHNKITQHYSFEELTRIHYSQENYDVALYYSDEELESIKNSHLPPTIIDAMKMAERLIKLHETFLDLENYTDLDLTTRLPKIIAKLSAISESCILAVHPHELIDYSFNIVRMMNLLRFTNETLCGKVNDHFKLGIETHGGSQVPLLKLMHHLYTEEGDYETVVSIGESLFRKMNGKKQDSMALYYMGESLFILGKFDESISYYEDIVMLPGLVNGVKYHACFQLLIMGSPNCLTLIPDLIKHHVNTMVEVLYIFAASDSWTPVSYPSNSQLMHTCVEDNFLSVVLRVHYSISARDIRRRPLPDYNILTSPLHQIFDYLPSRNGIHRAFLAFSVILYLPAYFSYILFWKVNEFAKSYLSMTLCICARAKIGSYYIRVISHWVVKFFLLLLFLFLIILAILLYGTVIFLWANIFQYIFTYSSIIYKNINFIIMTLTGFFSLQIFRVYKTFFLCVSIILLVSISFFNFDLFIFFLFKMFFGLALQPVIFVTAIKYALSLYSPPYFHY